jgi:hypothetical protein
MSSLDEDFTMQEMEESGEMQFIRDHVAAARGEDPAPAPEADTVEEEEQTEEVEEEESEEEGGDAEQTDDSSSDDEDDTIYLDLDEETQALLESKYGGDLNAMLRAAREGQSLIGRQGNELGAVRQELEQLRQQIQQGLVNAQPYPEWPDEYADERESVAQLRLIAETAFSRGDVQTFQRAIGSWDEVDPVSSSLYRDLKEMQIAQSMAQQQAPVQDDEATLQKGLEEIRTKFPQFDDDTFKKEVAAELDKTPSLKAVLWEGVPGVTPQERLNVLEEAAQRVASRRQAETAQRARQRVAVRASEEARAARIAAQSVRGGTARDETPEPEPRTVPLGETGRTLNLDRLNAMLDPDDRV